MKKILVYTGLAILSIIAILAINLVICSITAERISEGSPIPEYEKPGAALLVVDIQEGTTGIVSVTDTYIHQAEGLIQKINQLAKESGIAEVPVIYIRSEVSNPLLNILNNTMAKGTAGAKLDQRLSQVSEHIVVKKKGDSFFDTQLDNILAGEQVNHIYLTGLDAAHCVNCTLQAAIKRGYQVTVIEDAVISDPVDKKKAIIEQFRDLGVKVIGSEQYVASLSGF